MNTARRLLLMFALTATVVVGGITLNYALNPYGAWRIEMIDPIFRKVEHERMVTPYLLRTAKPETILLGTSRVLMGMRVEQGERAGVMNAALTAATIPQLSRIVAVAIENPQLKRIVWGVDFFSFDSAWNHVDPKFDARIAGSIGTKFQDTLLSAAAFGDGYEFAQRATQGKRKLRETVAAPLPWPMPLVCEQFGATREHGLNLMPPTEIEDELSQDLPDYSAYRFSGESFASFRGAVAEAQHRGIDVVMFIPPMSQYELELIRQGGRWEAFQDFKRAIAALGPFWDFSGYNAIARDDQFFMHVMHFKVAVGQLILRIVLKESVDPCSDEVRSIVESAKFVSEANLASTLAAQDRMREAATHSKSKYSRLAAQSIARRARERGVDASESAGAVDDASEPAFAKRTRRR
jgi:hypothetical protein